MGNKCSSPCTRHRKSKEKLDSSNPALVTIREAQRKYFNSHIESDIDDSDDDLEIDQEDSVDNIYGSVDSLDAVDCASVDSQLDDTIRSSRINRRRSSEMKSTGPIPLAQREDSTVSFTHSKSCESGTLIPNGQSFNENGSTAEGSKRDSGNGSATHIIPAEASVVSSTPVENSDATKNGCRDGSVENPRSGSTKKADDNGGNATEGTAKKGARSPVKRRNKKRKFITLSRRGNFFSIFNTEDKKARSVDPSKYEYPFENLVFEGGGNKGLAYCGAVRVSTVTTSSFYFLLYYQYLIRHRFEMLALLM
ncbi:hypothetical protein ElyMa_004349600 [Elysia marginata]|uniref:Uncharacterized protein n=1 Tax=Elysia marginata TaxID=1093978 RepID=A0AAV4H413_9GAST|nr:hypothetical protein ElyMa_004349600 [Elysia marginata]